MNASLESLIRGRRRKVFVSYHHGGDQPYYDELTRLYHSELEALTDNSLDRVIESDDPGYIMRRIREVHLMGSSCTIVLCGAGTPGRKYVDWEIQASLNQSMGIVGIMLPTIRLGANNQGSFKPKRLQDNIDSGYALWVGWNALNARPALLLETIEAALARPAGLIDNSAQRMMRNA